MEKGKPPSNKQNPFLKRFFFKKGFFNLFSNLVYWEKKRPPVKRKVQVGSQKTIMGMGLPFLGGKKICNGKNVFIPYFNPMLKKKKPLERNFWYFFSWKKEKWKNFHWRFGKN